MQEKGPGFQTVGCRGASLMRRFYVKASSMAVTRITSVSAQRPAEQVELVRWPDSRCGELYQVVIGIAEI